MLEEKVRQFLRDESGLQAGDTLVVGLSGGPDSVCLLHILTTVAPEIGLRLHVAHFDHGLRGGESASDARFCVELAESLGLPITVGQGDVIGYRQSHRCSLEQAARGLRYPFFAQTVKQLGAQGVAVGHTADDQVETVLLHLFRGTGLAGLRGMLPKRQLLVPDSTASDTEPVPLLVLRPLLSVSRTEVLAYCQEHRLSFRTDASNADRRFQRNRLRHEILPYLEARYPKVRQQLSRLAQLAAEDYAFIEDQVAGVWPQVANTSPSEVAFDLERWGGLPRPLQRHLLREGFRRLVGDIAGLESRHIDVLLGIAGNKEVGKAIDLPGGVRAVRKGLHLLFQRRGARLIRQVLECYRLAIPGVTRMPDWGRSVDVREVDQRCADRERWHADLDQNVVGQMLTVRSRQPGDRFRPLGLEGTKKVQDVLVDAKIPREERDRLPIVVTESGHIAWVAGVRLDGRAAASPQSQRVLCVRFQPLAAEGGDHWS